MKRYQKVTGLLLGVSLILQVLLGNGYWMIINAEENQVSYVESADRGFNVPVTWNEGDEAVTLPDAPEGWKIELFGSDRKEVVDLDGTVTRPIQDVTVNLLYKLTNVTTDAVIETNVNTSVLITAASGGFAAGSNACPQVIPSLREWKGGDGNITLTASSKIIVDAENYTAADAEHKKENIEKTSNFYTQINSFRDDLKDVTGLELEVAADQEPSAGDIYFTTKEAFATLGDEGYAIEFGGPDASQDMVIVRAVHKTGALYAGVTMLQILTQTGDNTLPKGHTRDYPQFEKRGYNLDVARTFLPLSYLEDTMKQMEWYKLNVFSLHLSDNDIWGPLTMGNELYSAYRLESDVPGLAAADGYYTKDEFRKLQYTGMDMGMNVIPELDTPGHALAYTRVWPDLERSIDAGNDKGKYLDVENPATLERVKALFDEYVIPQEGKEEVFVGPIVNIGTDEYKRGNKEAFRAYTDALLKHIVQRGKKAAFWGSLTENAGDTPVMTDALMYAWYYGYANAKDSLEAGYDVLSMEDQEVYIVPGGGYYNKQWGQGEYLYMNWLPNNNNGWAGRPAPLGHPRAVGGQFAVWNDWVGNGISVNDISFRIQYNMTSIAQKCWSANEGTWEYNEFKALGEELGDAPNADFLYTNQNFTDDKVVDIESTDDINAAGLTAINITAETEGKFDGGIRFNGGSSYLATGVVSTGFDWTMGMWLKPDPDNADDVVLMEGKTGTLKLKQGGSGRLGYSVDKVFDENGNPTVSKFNHSFDYAVPAGHWTHIALTGDAYGVKLYANGILIEELRDKEWPDFNHDSGSYGGMGKYYQTLMLPTAILGSETNSFKGTVDDLKIYDKVLSASEISGMAKISHDDNVNFALNKDVTASGTEVEGKWGPEQVTDGDKSGGSRWSSNYDDAAWLQVDLGEVQKIGKIDIYWEASYGVQYKMLVSKDGTDGSWVEVFNEETGEGGFPQSIRFPEQEARYVKFQGAERMVIGGSKWGYSMYEIEVFAPESGLRMLAEKINEVDALIGKGGLPKSYRKMLEQWLQEASDMLTDGNAGSDSTALEQIMEKIAGLLEKVACEVTFDANGGVLSETVKQVTKGDKVGELPVPARDNFIFQGWYLQKTGGTAAEESMVVNDDVTLYARWQEAFVPKPSVRFAKSEYVLYATNTVKTSVIKNTDAGAITGYSSSNKRVATISAKGIITGVKAGSTTITVKTKSGATAIAKVTVKKPKVTLNAKSVPLQIKKSTSVIKVKTKIATDRLVKYTSSNRKVATVNNKGVIKGIKKGTAKITFVMKSGATASCTLKVQKEKVTAKSISLSEKRLTLLKGKAKKLEVTRNPITATEKISWSSSNKKAATVDKNGKIKAVRKGTATITAKASNGKKATCKITVSSVKR